MALKLLKVVLSFSEAPGLGEWERAKGGVLALHPKQMLAAETKIWELSAGRTRLKEGR